MTAHLHGERLGRLVVGAGRIPTGSTRSSPTFQSPGSVGQEPPKSTQWTGRRFRPGGRDRARQAEPTPVGAATSSAACGTRCRPVTDRICSSPSESSARRALASASSLLRFSVRSLTAVRLLTENRNRLDALASALLAEDSLGEEQILSVTGLHRVPQAADEVAAPTGVGSA